MENLANTKEAEIVRLRAELKTAQAAIPVEPPKKIVVDDAQPEKKAATKPVVKRKPTPKQPPATKPPAGQVQPQGQVPAKAQ